MDRHKGKLKQDCKQIQVVAQKIKDDDSEHFYSNMCDGNPCCKKLKSRIGELELEICNLKKCISLLNSQLHEAQEKAEDISFIKNESVITLGDKLEAVTSMLEEKRTENVETVECKDNLVKFDLITLEEERTENVEIMDCKDISIKYDVVTEETPEEVCVKVKNELMAAEQKMSEISDCIQDIQLVCNLRESKINNIL